MDLEKYENLMNYISFGRLELPVGIAQTRKTRSNKVYKRGVEKFKQLSAEFEVELKLDRPVLFRNGKSYTGKSKE